MTQHLNCNIKTFINMNDMDYLSLPSPFISLGFTDFADANFDPKNWVYLGWWLCYFLNIINL